MTNDCDLSFAALARKGVADLSAKHIRRALRDDTSAITVDVEGESLLDSSPPETKITDVTVRESATSRGRFRFVSFSADMVIAEQPAKQTDVDDSETHD